MRPSPSIQPRSRAYRQLWRIVDSAVRDALAHHPEYLTPKGHINARRSITKRVTGAVLGYAVQAARGRSGSSPAAEGRTARTSSSIAQAFHFACARLWQSLCRSRPIPDPTPQAGALPCTWCAAGWPRYEARGGWRHSVPEPTGSVLCDAPDTSEGPR